MFPIIRLLEKKHIVLIRSQICFVPVAVNLIFAGNFLRKKFKCDHSSPRQTWKAHSSSSYKNAKNNMTSKQENEKNLRGQVLKIKVKRTAHLKNRRRAGEAQFRSK